MVGVKRTFTAVFLLLIQANAGYSFRVMDQEAVVLPPVEELNQSWRFASFLQDGGLLGRNIFFIDFEKKGTAWIAASDGLYRYDGYTWKHFTVADDLPSDFVRCVLVADDARLWVGTDRGAVVFDGTSFQTVTSIEGLDRSSVRRIVENSDGTLWFCYDRWPDATVPGGLSSYRSGEWTVYDQKDGLPSDHIMNYFQDSEGREFVLTLKGLAQREGDRWISPLERQGLPGYDQRFWTIAETPDVGIMATADDALFILKDGRWSRIAYEFSWESNIICSTHDGAILTSRHVNENNSALFQWNESHFDSVSGRFKSPEWFIEALREAPDGSIWCVGFNCLIRWDRANPEWTEYKNIPPPRFVDNLGRIWFARDHLAVRFDGNKWEKVHGLGGSVALGPDGDVWGWSLEGLYRYSRDGVKIYTEEETGLRIPSGYDVDAFGNSWFYGTDAKQNNVIATFDGFGWKTLTIPELQVGRIVQSAPDPVSGIWYLVSNEVTGEFRLVRFDNGNAEEYAVDARIRTFGTPPAFHVDARGDLWMYGEIGLYHLSKDHPQRAWERIEETPGRSVFLSVEREGEIWFGYNAATGGRGGLACFRDGKWSEFDVNVRGFAVRASDETIFFGGYETLYIIPSKWNGSPAQLAIPGSSKVCNVVKDPRGDLWLGCGGSVLRYRSDGLPPETFITRAGTDVSEGEPLEVQFSGVKKFVPLRGRKAIHYWWRIDSEPWSRSQATPENGLSTGTLHRGRHVLQVVAQDEGFDIDASPAEHEFFVRSRPLQERVWFKPALLVVFGLILLLALIALRARGKAARYARGLEETVSTRTAALAASEQRYRELFENANDIVYTHDLTGQFTSLNKAGEKVTGYTRDEAIQLNIAQIAIPEHVPRARQMIERRFAGAGSTTYELGIITKDGRTLLLEVSTRLICEDGKPVAVQGIARDITERKRAEEALEKSEQLYRAAIEVAGAVPYYQNYTPNTYEFVGPGIQSLIGYSPEEFTPQVWESITEEIILLGNLAGMSLDEAVRRARGEEGVSWRADYRVRTRGREERWLSNAAVQVRNDQGSVAGSLGILQDITERKRLEEQLRQAQKIEAVGQLAGGIAHDFNNLLTGIIGNLRLAQRRSPEEIRKFLVRAEDAADRAANLVQQLLDFSRKSQIELRPVNVNQIVTEVYALAREIIDRRIEMVLEVEENLPDIFADASQIHSVLVNLCVNARDAISDVMLGHAAPHRRSDRFVITIQTETTIVDRQYCEGHSYARPGRFVVLCVSDNGAGMDEETQDRIFEPFFTTKEVGKGTGLGLSSAYGIIKQHSGWVDLQSEPGRGTTFRIYLPVTEEETQKRETETYKEAPPGTETILLVDDEEMIRSLGQMILESHGYTVLLAADGKEGLDLYLKERQRISVIVLDLSMPHLSGYEMLEQVHKLAPNAKVIVSSGYSQKGQIESLDRPGVAAYVAKPYRPADLARTVREVLDR